MSLITALLDRMDRAGLGSSTDRLKFTARGLIVRGGKGEVRLLGFLLLSLGLTCQNTGPYMEQISRTRSLGPSALSFLTNRNPLIILISPHPTTRFSHI